MNDKTEGSYGLAGEVFNLKARKLIDLLFDCGEENAKGAWKRFLEFNVEKVRIEVQRQQADPSPTEEEQ